MKGFMERNEELIKTTMVALKLNYREQTEDQRTILEKHRSVDIPKVKKGKRKKEKGKRKKKSRFVRTRATSRKTSQNG